MDDVDQFILSQIESVPHLEALLLMWRSVPTAWTIVDLTQRLYMPTDDVERVLEDLVQRNLVVMRPGLPVKYSYASGSDEQDRLLRAVDESYRRELIRISNLIYSKPPASVRKFARAFRFTREKK